MFKVCSVCGTTIEDFRRTGLLGCTNCYRVFREEILPAVRNMQGALQHEGKKIDQLYLERERLKSNLEKALREQNYAEADILQDKLKELILRNSKEG